MTDNANLYARLSAGFDPAAIAIETPQGVRISFGELDALSGQAARALRDLGAEPGDRVSVISGKSLEFLWLYLGCLRAGCIFHPLNPGYTQNELAFFFTNAGTRFLLHDAALTGTVISAASQCPSVAVRLTLDDDGGGEWRALREGASATTETMHSDAGDTAALLYSSGTTGTPKGIRITHGNLYDNACALRDAWAFRADDILLHALPVYHVHGLFITLGPALLAGTRLRFLPRFDADAVIDALPGATMMAGVPTYYSRLLANPRFDVGCCDTVRVFISGSAPLSEAAFAAFRERTGHAILERYGMTETGINTSNPLAGERKPGSVGPPLGEVAVRVCDDHGRPCPQGEVGAIQVRGANVFPGYWNLPEASAAAFDADGWFDTGDQGYFDDDGYLFIVGRSKDMVISGGLNVYPKEVEREVEKLEGVAEAAVFGVPHDDFGEAVIAAVIVEAAAPEEAAAIAELKQHLAGFKVPKRLLVLDELPRNSMGKVQKNRLRETYADLFADGGD